MSGIHVPTNKFTLFQNIRFDSVFYLSCASRSPSFDGGGFLMCGCLALLDLRSAMLTLVGTVCRRRIHLPVPFKKLCPESTFRQINSRCFKTSVLTAFFYLSCASRSPSFDGGGFLMCGCLALLDLRSAMLTLVGTACRRRIHLQTYKFTLFQNIRFDSVFLFVLRCALPIFRCARGFCAANAGATK